MATLDPSLDSSIQNRKKNHLDLCQTEAVNSEINAGFEKITLPHVALPELNFDEVSIQTSFLGKKFSAPLLISSMTGGFPEGEKLNTQLACFAQEVNIPMGVGSQRIAIENRQSDLFNLRRSAPRATLYANIGLVQLNYGVDINDLQWIVEKLEASALILHTNVLQECIQNEGNRNFSNLFSKISEIKRHIEVPVILKETGCGLDVATVKKAIRAGVDAVDVAGMGGTHWGFIEGLRSTSRKELGEQFRNWGIPTVTALQQLRSEIKNSFPVIASGGIKNGIEMAKSLFLGAQMAGMALEFLKQAKLGDQALLDFYNIQTEALKIALFCSGSKTIAEFQSHE